MLLAQGNITVGRQATSLIYAFSSIFFDRISTISSFSVSMSMGDSRTLPPTLQLGRFHSAASRVLAKTILLHKVHHRIAPLLAIAQQTSLYVFGSVFHAQSNEPGFVFLS